MKSWKASLTLVGRYPGWYAASAIVWMLAFFVVIGTGLAMQALLNLLAAGPARLADGSAGFFCQLQLSAMELDDTRKPSDYREGPRRFRFSISAV